MYWMTVHPFIIGFGPGIKKMANVWMKGTKVLCCIRQNYEAIDILFISYLLILQILKGRAKGIDTLQILSINSMFLKQMIANEGYLDFSSYFRK